MITRIVMDRDMLTPLKKFIKGQVYDSRIPLDYPVAADGIQHSISQDFLDRFIAEGWAHEQTWNEHPLCKPTYVNTGMSCQEVL